MPSATDNKDEMDEARLLAPWYAAGKLDPAGKRLGEDLADQDEDFARSIEEAREEVRAAVSLNEAAGEPSAALWARIDQSIEQEKKARSSQWFGARAVAFKDTVSRFFAGLSLPQLQAVAATAVAVCVLEAGAIGYLAGGEAPAKFHVASGPKMQTAPKQAAFIVSFQDGATIAQIGKVLGDAGATIVEGPTADMIYRLGLRGDSVEAKDRAYAKLQASGLTKLILPEK